MTDPTRRAAAEQLVAATITLAQSGTSLMERVAPPGGAFVIWEHYPPDDAVDAASGCRWFYHAHPPGERDAGEHGHFHLFFDRRRFARGAARPLAAPPGNRSSGADVVHIVGIAIDLQGLPTRLFTVNRWVTDEWLYPAPAIARRLPRFDLARASGDPLVNRWLTAAVAFFRPDIAAALAARDLAIAGSTTPALFEDREVEVMSSIAIAIDQAAEAL